MKKFFCFALLLLTCGIFLTGCFGSVVPCAWVRLDMDGYIYYSSNVYASGGDHIYLYETEEDAEGDKHHVNCILSVVFYPRILGADTVNGVRTTTVDVSAGYSMTVNVYKKKSLYSADKKVYLNGEQIEASNTYDSEYLRCLTFENFTLTRGNPNGHFNEIVNVIEYK